MSNSLTLLTFLRGQEEVNQSFFTLCLQLSQVYEVHPIIITESDCSYDNAEIITVSPSTKYEKITHVLPKLNSEYVVCIDADLTILVENTIEMINRAIGKQLDLAWGKITISEIQNAITHLVFLDKHLSHNLIRPSLWACRVGVSIPGQLFLFKLDTMKGSFLFENTFLDDLAVGMYARCNSSIKVKGFHRILAYEYPSITCSELFKQRARWAHGYRSLLLDKRASKYLKFLIIHGVAYHMLWIIGAFILYALMTLHCAFGMLFFLSISLVLCMGRLRLLAYAFLYQFFFPWLHTWWMINLLKKR